MTGEKQQKQLLCSLPLFPHTLSSSSSDDHRHYYTMKKKKKLRRENNNGLSGGFIIHASLLRHGSRRHRRHFLHFLPFVSVLFVLFIFGFLSPPIISSNHISRRNSVDNGSDDGLNANGRGGASTLNRDLWSTSSSEFYYGCCNPSNKFLTADIKTHPDRYLLISTSGGLNQQRTGITDAVIAAYILNATLVVPMLDQKSYWNDASNFGDIFDVDWFISYLVRDVKIIKQLPTVRDKVLTPPRTRVPRKCTPDCYLKRILPLLKKKNAVQLTKFDYRLSNKLDNDLQKLRCRVNYHALRFTDPILEMGQKLVERMRTKGKHFIALHLRFEPDMLAFSGCDYGGGENERKELGAIRKRWKTLHNRNPDKQRRQGRCPFTPEEVGLMLRALGYDSDVHIYVASGEVYHGEETLAPLKALFPNFHSKDTIASKEELAPFVSYSSRMAALDFIVCDESDVFVANNNGNMARILAGRRRYFGHKPTIRPNAKKLYHLFLHRSNMTWEQFSSEVRTQQIGFMGEPNEVKPGRGEFHENPAACICKSPLAKAGRNSSLQSDPTVKNENRQEHGMRNDAAGVSDDRRVFDDEEDPIDAEYIGKQNGLF